jgi:type I restriction enzyme S subunit
MRAVEPEGGGLLRPEVATYGEVKKGYTSFLSGDVIMAKITPCMENGKTCVVPELVGATCFGSTEFHVLRAEPGIQSRWIANYLLRQSTRHAAQRQMAGGVGQMRVPSAFLGTLSLPLPPEREQVRILDTLDELLSDLDAGVAALDRVRTKLKHYRATVLKAAVEGALTAEWRRQHPATESADALLTRILAERRRRWEEVQVAKFAAGGRTPPKDWKAKYVEPVLPDTTGLPTLGEGARWVSLDQIAAIAGGVTKGQKVSDGVPTRDISYLRVANVQRGYLDLAEIKQIRATEQDIEALRLRPGDVLFNEGGDRDKLGRGWIWEGQIEECIHQNHVFRARLFVEDVRPKIVSWAGNSYGQKWFMRTGKQSVNLASINMTVLRSFPIPLFPPAEQDAIVEAIEDQLSVIDHLEQDIERRLTGAQKLRQSILRHAFTGQLVPQDSNDEPASELLKRIAIDREERSRFARATKQAAPRNRVPRGRTKKK